MNSIDQCAKSLLSFLIQNIYTPAGFLLTSGPKYDTESSKYGACSFDLNGRSVVFRIANQTPKKMGYFVTIWKRVTPSSYIEPFNIGDNIDFIIISVCDEITQGQFIFSKEVLVKMNIILSNNKLGKMAIRVYPPWVKLMSEIALKTQQWQFKYFIPILGNNTVDVVLLGQLLK